MLKILQARLQQYVNRELPDVWAGFRKGRGTTDQIANISWIIKKAREFQKNIYFCFIDYPKAFDCVYQNKLWKIMKEMGIPDHLTCLLRNLYAGEEATVRTRHGTTDWLHIGKGVRYMIRKPLTTNSAAFLSWFCIRPIRPLSLLSNSLKLLYVLKFWRIDRSLICPMKTIFKNQANGALQYYFLLQAVLTIGGKITHCYLLGRVFWYPEAKRNLNYGCLWRPVFFSLFIFWSYSLWVWWC